MEQRSLELLKSIYDKSGQDILPFTDYIIEFETELGMSIKELLNLYALLLDNGYIVSFQQDNIFLTEKGLSEIFSNKIK